MTSAWNIYLWLKMDPQLSITWEDTCFPMTNCLPGSIWFFSVKGAALLVIPTTQDCNQIPQVCPLTRTISPSFPHHKTQAFLTAKGPLKPRVHFNKCPVETIYFLYCPVQSGDAAIFWSPSALSSQKSFLRKSTITLLTFWDTQLSESFTILQLNILVPQRCFFFFN